MSSFDFTNQTQIALEKKLNNVSTQIPNIIFNKQDARKNMNDIIHNIRIYIKNIDILNSLYQDVITIDGAKYMPSDITDSLRDVLFSLPSQINESPKLSPLYDIIDMKLSSFINGLLKLNKNLKDITKDVISTSDNSVISIHEKLMIEITKCIRLLRSSYHNLQHIRFCDFEKVQSSRK